MNTLVNWLINILVGTYMMSLLSGIVRT